MGCSSPTGRGAGSSRTGYREPLYLGSALIAIDTIGLEFYPSPLSAYLWLALATCLTGIKTGVSSPTGRNADLQLAPEQPSALAALRSTGRQVEKLAAVSITTAIVAQAGHHGDVQAKAYFVFGALLILCLPVIARIPEYRGSW